MSDTEKTTDSTAHEVAKHDKVPLRQKLAYSLGITADHYSCNKGLNVFFLPFFNDMLGISAAALGVIQMLSRAWDAINDPLIGWLSDRSKSRFGRRRPFIFAGAILTGLTFPLLWLVPEGMSPMATYLAIGAGVMLLYTSYSLFSVPYESLGAELTPDYHERTNIFVVRMYILATLNRTIDFMFPLVVILGSWSLVGSDVAAVRIVGILMGAIIIVTGIMPALFCRERYQHIATEQTKDKEAKLGFTGSIRAILSNKPLMLIIGIMAFYLFAVISAQAFLYYINTYMLFDGDRKKGVFLTLYQTLTHIPFSILGAYLVKKLGHRFEKHQLMKVSVGMLALGFLSCFITFRPDMPLLSLASKPLWALGESWFWILVLSMRADICDWDELQTGHRREGLIAATTNWFNKLGTALALFFGGFCLEVLAGFDKQVPESAKDPVVMQKLMNWYVGLPVAGASIAFVLLCLYQLNAKRMAEVRNTLEARRGQAVADDASLE